MSKTKQPFQSPGESRRGPKGEAGAPSRGDLPRLNHVRPAGLCPPQRAPAHGTWMKLEAMARRRAEESPVLASSTGTVLSTQWVVSSLLSLCLGTYWVRSIFSTFSEAWKTWGREETGGRF